MIINNSKMVLFSSNFYKASLDGKPKIGIVITNPEQIKQVQETFEADWQDSDHN